MTRSEHDAICAAFDRILLESGCRDICTDCGGLCCRVAPPSFCQYQGITGCSIASIGCKAYICPTLVLRLEAVGLWPTWKALCRRTTRRIFGRRLNWRLALSNNPQLLFKTWEQLEQARKNTT
jgi:hypothetical protein